MRMIMKNKAMVSTVLNFVRMFVNKLELEKKKAQKEAENVKAKLDVSKKESENLLSSPQRNAGTK
ncbi:hypothetical protein J5N97_022830 [Dioscorea zingiberensis]|uniref:Uncharacterized protein n=1 Tax=Dioscorea zingiberensis TaxID=325984 RepID=A0A9D5CBY4_9LILI|nr:hypothetical protein J5N97_022830 [Dioscorea zingiberensis]